MHLILIGYLIFVIFSIRNRRDIFNISTNKYVHKGFDRYEKYNIYIIMLCWTYDVRTRLVDKLHSASHVFCEKLQSVYKYICLFVYTWVNISKIHPNIQDQVFSSLFCLSILMGLVKRKEIRVTRKVRVIKQALWCKVVVGSDWLQQFSNMTTSKSSLKQPSQG